MSASFEKLRKNDEDGDKGPQRKKTCVRSSTEPDVIITVGGVEFQENSQTLRCWSDYFDKALRSGMKESHSKRFEFPDRNPTEWEWLMEVSSALTTEELTKANVYTALDWYGELCSQRGLDKCDFVLFYSVIPSLGLDHETTKTITVLDPDGVLSVRERFGKLLDALAASIQYGLPRTKADCFGILRRVLKDTPYLFFTSDTLERLISFLKNDEECHDGLWPSFEMHLSESALKQEKEFLITSGLLHDLVWLSICAYDRAS